MRNYQKVIKSSLRDATNYFGFINIDIDPARNLQIPRAISFELKKQAKTYIFSLRFRKNDTFICAFLTACYTGMRTGEVFALTWK